MNEAKKPQKFDAKSGKKTVIFSLHQNAGRLIFRPAFGMCSTQSLVEIYNKLSTNKPSKKCSMEQLFTVQLIGRVAWEDVLLHLQNSLTYFHSKQ